MLNRILKRDESRCLNVRKRKETKELRGIQFSITFLSRRFSHFSIEISSDNCSNKNDPRIFPFLV